MTRRIFYDIPGYDGSYQINKYGDVKSIKFNKERILRPSLNKPGYKFVILRNNGVSVNEMVHRLVACTFMSNDKCECVNHIDGDKLNNHVDNLEWVTFSENRKHAFDNNLAPQRGFPVKCKLTYDDGRSHSFDTIRNLTSYLGVHRTWVHQHMRKLGCTFKYENFTVEVIYE